MYGLSGTKAVQRSEGILLVSQREEEEERKDCGALRMSDEAEIWGWTSHSLTRSITGAKWQSGAPTITAGELLCQSPSKLAENHIPLIGSTSNYYPMPWK